MVLFAYRLLYIWSLIMVRKRDFINDIQLLKTHCIYRQFFVFCPITLLKVVLVYFNNNNFTKYVITCLHGSCLVELLSNVIYAVLGCYKPPKWCSISCYMLSKKVFFKFYGLVRGYFFARQTQCVLTCSV